MLTDPPPAPELSENLVRASDLKNRVLIIRPTGVGEWPAKDDKAAQPYIEADTWVLDRQGIESFHQGVRYSWWRAVAQLRNCMGMLVACRPVERDDRSVELAPLPEAPRKVAEQVAAQIDADGQGVPAFEDGSEPF